MSGALRHELRTRQLNELEAMQAMFSIDGSFVCRDEESLQLMKVVVDSCSSPEQFVDEGLPELSFEITKDALYSVIFNLPKDYPHRPLHCRIEWQQGTRAEHEYINGNLRQYADSLAGEESAMQVLEKAGEIFTEILNDKKQEEAEAEALRQDSKPMFVRDAGQKALGRRLIYFHHIINPTKRQCVQEWAVQLKLGGYSKIGWPGIVVVEGPEECCQEYVRCLQRLRWKQIVVRGEEIEPCPNGMSIDQMRKMHYGFEELDCNGMSELAERCRKAGLEELFLTGMKIYRNSDKEGEQASESKTTGRRKN
eukprot:761537-Hanusia_phi.AAC.2